MIIRHILTWGLLLLSFSPLWAQYQTVGNAFGQTIPGFPGDCFVLTPDLADRTGAVWHTQAVDLTEPQDWQASFFLGAKDANGADGIAFVLRDTNTVSLGGIGGGFGYSSLPASIGIEFDTWENAVYNDSSFDHMGLSYNGGLTHGGATSLVPPVRILPGIDNAEDAQFHALRITWDPVDDSLHVYVDCTLRFAYEGDLMNIALGGDSIVYWGFTGATGGAFNLQQVCIDTVINTLPPQTFTICEGDSLPLMATFLDGDEYQWLPTDSLTTSDSSATIAFPSDTTTYVLRYKDLCGVRTVEEFVINVIPSPSINIGFGDTLRLCANFDTLLNLPFAPASYLWQDGSTDSTFTVTQPGLVWAEVTSGCTIVRDSIYADYDTIASVSLPSDTTLCEDDTLSLDVSDPRAVTIFWQDGTMGPQYDITNNGLYWVALVNRCGIASDTILVQYDSLPRFELGDDQLLCDEATYVLDAFYRDATYEWQDGSTDTTFLVTSSTGSGIYWAETTNQCGSWRDSVLITYDSIPQIELGVDLERCEGDSITLDATWPGSSYLWSTGDTTDTLRVGQNGTYSVTVSNVCGVDRDSMQATFLPIPSADLGEDTLLCSPEPWRADLSQPGATYLWSDGSAEPTFQTAQAGTYSVFVERAGCSSRDTIVITTGRPPSVALGLDRQLLCDGATTTLDASNPDGSISYLWNTGSTDPVLTVSESGIYAVTLQNLCGTAQDQVEIETSNTPVVNLPPDTVICEGDSLRLDATFPDATYRWQDGSTNPTLFANEAGIYEVEVRTACGERSDLITVQQVSPPVVDLGVDTTVCEGQVLRLRVQEGQGNILWQDGSTDGLLSVRTSGSYSVSVDNNACEVIDDAVQIEFINCECEIFAPNAFTPNDDTFNERFLPIPTCNVENYELVIFDRWGRVLFRTQQPDEGWGGTSTSGRAVPVGVYAWALRYQFPGALGMRQANYSGSVTLIR